MALNTHFDFLKGRRFLTTKNLDAHSYGLSEIEVNSSLRGTCSCHLPPNRGDRKWNDGVMSDTSQNQTPSTEPKAIRSTRRNFLKGGAAAIAASAAVTSVAPASAQSSWGYFNKPAPLEPSPQPLPFCHGVASGDPLPDSVILWTRVTPDENARPGSGTGEATDVRWEVSPNESFDSVVASGTARTSRSSDHTLHIDVKGLAPASVYYYRFIVEGGPHALSLIHI